MKYWVKAGIVIIAIILESVLGNVLKIETVKPDLILITVICLSFLSSSEEGVIVGFAGGLLKDIFSINLLGTNALVKTIIGYLSGIIRERIFHEHLLGIITIATFFFTLFNNILIYLLLNALHSDYDFAIMARKFMLFQALLNCIIAPFVFLAIKKLLDYCQR
jgi:rod shape-determining protein MreD